MKNLVLLAVVFSSVSVTAAPAGLKCNLRTFESGPAGMIDILVKIENVGLPNQKTTVTGLNGEAIPREAARFVAPNNVSIPGYDLIIVAETLGGVRLEVQRRENPPSPLFSGEIALNSSNIIFDSKAGNTVQIRCIAIQPKDKRENG